MAKEERRIRFDAQGKLISADGASLPPRPKRTQQSALFQKRTFSRQSSVQDYDIQEEDETPPEKLHTSSDLAFLKDSADTKVANEIFEESYWNLHANGNEIPPLKFSNGKTQEDVVKEIVTLIKGGKKVIFLHGVCGSGKSAIALNIARSLKDKASIVVPLKSLQRQYEDDYLGKKYLTHFTGRKMKIASITGRDNHDSLFVPGASCADPSLPENIKITDKNYGKLIEYYQNNPHIENKEVVAVEDMKRLSVAPTNPYWSPILPAEFEIQQFKQAKKYKYHGVNGKEFIFYHRKSGCSYYDQFLAYKLADIIIYNAAKFKSEMAMGRKPLTAVDVIDEADDFLDSLFQQEEMNLTRLAQSLKLLTPEKMESRDLLQELQELLFLEERNKKAIGVDENEVVHVKETKLQTFLESLLASQELTAHIALDELNYANTALQAAENFAGLYEDVYVTFRKDEENLYARLVSTNLSAKFADLMKKSKAMVFMSGTLHSENILRKIFKIEDFSVVEAETLNLGNIEIHMTGREMDCRYASMQAQPNAREHYLYALQSCMEKASRPTLIHVQTFMDLPTEEEKNRHELHDIMSSEQLKSIQREDKKGAIITRFKEGEIKSLFTTKCSRGVDFPGDTCKSIVFTKYPNPNVSDTFWKILQKTHPNEYWEFYKDKAYREFLQRIYRGVRSKTDHVMILSPDIRIIQEVRKLQHAMLRQ